MIISGVLTAAAAVTTLVSGTVFKRAFDQRHQEQSHRASSPIVPKVSPAAGVKVLSDSGPAVHVGEVQSFNQKGGVTAGYVNSIKQEPGD